MAIVLNHVQLAIGEFDTVQDAIERNMSEDEINPIMSRSQDLMERLHAIKRDLAMLWADHQVYVPDIE